jgi:hypothetical protein
MTKLLTILFFFTTTLLFGQTKALDNFFAQVRAGKYPNIPAEVNKPESATTLLNALPIYFKDTMVLVRSKAAAIARTIGTKSKVATVRTKAVQQLLNATRDKNSGNTGAALMYLTEFKKTDFSKANKDSLHNLLKRRSAHIDVVMKLIGYLEMQEANNELYALSQDVAMGRKERWTSMLALARMGDDRAAEDIMNRVKRMPVTDAVVYEIFPDLVYSRSQEAITYLVEALNSDAKNCESANAESEEKIPCAYRVMEMLAPVIENYPLKLSESGDIETTDYPGALQKVRDWFKINRQYKILKDRY